MIVRGDDTSDSRIDSTRLEILLTGTEWEGLICVTLAINMAVLTELEDVNFKSSWVAKSVVVEILDIIVVLDGDNIESLLRV